MKNLLTMVCVICLGMSCGGGGGKKDTPDTTGQDETIWNPIEPEEDTQAPPDTVQDSTPGETTAELIEDTQQTEAAVDTFGPDTPQEDTPQVETFCGDHICTFPEDEYTCGRDCILEPFTAVFFFANKGDEWAAMGRIYDLLQAGCRVMALYIAPPDETPLATTYSGNKNLLSLVKLGVTPAYVILFEEYQGIWPLMVGPHAVLDQVEAIAKTYKPAEVYLPQLCGGDYETELAHVVGWWGTKRAGIYPQPTFFEIPARSAYYVTTDPGPELAQTTPDLYIDILLKRWKLIPKTTNEQKTELRDNELLAIKVAAEAIKNPWFNDARAFLGQEKLLYLLGSAQRFRKLPNNQDPEQKPWISSTNNPDGIYIYMTQGFILDDFIHFVRHTQAFNGTDIYTDPSHLPYYDQPMLVKIINWFEFSVLVKNVGGLEDTISFEVGIDSVKNPTDDCAPNPADITIPAKGSKTVAFRCNAAEVKGLHTFYIRANSKVAAEALEPSTYSEVPFQFKVW